MTAAETPGAGKPCALLDSSPSGFQPHKRVFLSALRACRHRQPLILHGDGAGAGWR